VLRSSCGTFVQGGASESGVDARRQVRASEGDELDMDVAKLRQVQPLLSIWSLEQHTSAVIPCQVVTYYMSLLAGVPGKCMKDWVGQRSS
jgi:hypothetical protein